MASSNGNIMIFSPSPPVLILKDFIGGKPKRIGIGKSQGTPWVVSESVKRCDKYPIIIAHNTISILTKSTDPSKGSRRGSVHLSG